MASSFKRGRCLLRPLLKQRKTSQTELARRTGISRQMIVHYIAGKPMPLDKAKTIASVLDCNIEDLYEWIIE